MSIRFGTFVLCGITRPLTATQTSDYISVYIEVHIAWLTDIHNITSVLDIKFLNLLNLYLF